MLHNRFRLITRPAVVVLDRPKPEDSDIDDEEMPSQPHRNAHLHLKRDSHSLLACVSLRGRRQPSHEEAVKREAVLIDSEEESESGSESLVFVRKVTSAECLKRKLRRQATVCNKVKLERRDEGAPECSICLTALKDLSEKEVGRLGCGHAFCFGCILESSKFSNRCPYCRTAFSSIRHGKRLTAVADARLNEGFDDPMDEPCYICGRNDDFERLLECEYCEYAYCHTYCDVRLNSDRPPLGNWYCLSCVELLNNQLDPHSAAQEIFEDSS